LTIFREAKKDKMLDSRLVINAVPRIGLQQGDSTVHRSAELTEHSLPDEAPASLDDVGLDQSEETGADETGADETGADETGAAEEHEESTSASPDNSAAQLKIRDKSTEVWGKIKGWFGQ
jgi:hypothetical protein